MQGFNSEGVQAVLAQGISTCWRTGKLQCVPCFRGYARQAFKAGDDLEMALHHARADGIKPQDARQLDRRWSGAYEEADMLLLAGRLG